VVLATAKERGREKQRGREERWREQQGERESEKEREKGGGWDVFAMTPERPSPSI